MTKGFNLNFFNAAMKALRIGMTSEDFAKIYANESKAEKGSSIWQKAYEEGLKQFSSIDIHKGSEGVIDEDEMKIVGLYVERMNGKDHKLAQTIEGFSGNTMLEGMLIRETKGQQPSNPNLPEQHNLKPVSAMTKEEIEAELARYEEMGLVEQDQKQGLQSDFEKKQSQNLSEISDDKPILPEQELKILRKQLMDVRSRINETDKNSDVVDFHIGTFNQGGLSDCVMLSQLNGMSDEQISRMMKRKIDENGKVYYEVTFPIDSGSGQSVIVTEEEVQSRSLTVREGDITRTIVNFSTGDADVTLMEMAYIRRFGVDPSVMGADMKFVNDVFTYPQEGKRHVGSSWEVTEEKLISAMQNNEHATVALKHASRLPEDFSYNDVFQSDSGVTTQMGLVKSDSRKTVLMRLEDLFRKNGNENPDMTEYMNMSDSELMDAVNRFVSRDFWFTGELRLSSGVSIMEDHAYTLKSYNPETKELTIANPHSSNEDIIIPLDIAQRFFEISI